MRDDKINVIVKKIDWQIMEDNFEKYEAVLYPARRNAVERLNNQRAKLASLATGLLLQKVAKDELGIEPCDLVVGKGKHGKPYIENFPNFEFNISHSGDAVAIAYGENCVGLDIENIRCRENDLKVAKRCFLEPEYIFVTDDAFELDMDGISHPVEERFFMVWTMKEAYLKYKGTGISVPMNSFEVKPYEGIVVGEKLRCKPLIIDGYVCTVCVDDGVDVKFDFEGDFKLR